MGLFDKLEEAADEVKRKLDQKVPEKWKEKAMEGLNRARQAGENAWDRAKEVGEDVLDSGVDLFEDGKEAAEHAKALMDLLVTQQKRLDPFFDPSFRQKFESMSDERKKADLEKLNQIF